MTQPQDFLWVQVDNKGRPSSAAPTDKTLRSHRAIDWNRKQRATAIALFRGDSLKGTSGSSTPVSSRDGEAPITRLTKHISTWRLEKTRSSNVSRPLRELNCADPRAGQDESCTLSKTSAVIPTFLPNATGLRPASPSTMLDTGHFDPFNQIVIPLDRESLRLLQLQCTVFHSRLIPAKIGEQYQESLFQGMPHDSVMILGLCCAAVANLPSLASSKTDMQKFAAQARTRGLQLKLLTIQEINARLRQDQNQLYEPSTYWALLSIALYDLTYGTHKELEIHLIALQKLWTLGQTRISLPLAFTLTFTAIVNLDAAIHNKLPLFYAPGPNWEIVSEAVRSCFFETSLRKHARLAGGLLNTKVPEQLSHSFKVAIKQLLTFTIFDEAITADPVATTLDVKDEFIILRNRVTGDLLHLPAEVHYQSSILVEGIRLALLAFIYSVRLNKAPTNKIFIAVATHIRRVLSEHDLDFSNIDRSAQMCFLWVIFMGFHLLSEDPAADERWFLDKLSNLARLVVVPSHDHSGDERLSIFREFFYVDRVHGRSLKIVVMHLATREPRHTMPC